MWSIRARFSTVGSVRDTPCGKGTGGTIASHGRLRALPGLHDPTARHRACGSGVAEADVCLLLERRALDWALRRGGFAPDPRPERPRRRPRRRLAGRGALRPLRPAQEGALPLRTGLSPGHGRGGRRRGTRDRPCPARRAPLKIRSAIYPAVAFASNAWIWLLILGAVLGALNLVALALGLYAVAVAFHLVTLPVEFNASRRAAGQLR